MNTIQVLKKKSIDVTQIEEKLLLCPVSFSTRGQKSFNMHSEFDLLHHLPLKDCCISLYTIQPIGQTLHAPTPTQNFDGSYLNFHTPIRTKACGKSLHEPDYAIFFSAFSETTIGLFTQLVLRPDCDPSMRDFQPKYRAGKGKQKLEIVTTRIISTIKGVYMTI